MVLLQGWAESRGIFSRFLTLLDVAGLPSAVLLGSSSGGYVAQQVAVNHPERVDGLVLVGSPRTLQGRAPFADQVEALRDPVDPAWVRESLDWFPRIQAVPGWYVQDRVRDGTAMPARAWQASLEGLCRSAPPTGAVTFAAPTLIPWGARDTALTWEQEQLLAAAIADARLIAYEDTGHLVLWERPESVAADLLAFLEHRARRQPTGREAGLPRKRSHRR